MKEIIHTDAVQWANEYEGELFHALFCDSPYHLTTITKRFGKNGSKPAKGGVYARSSKGFMGKQWDGGDVAFRPETWAAFMRVMYPGAFGMTFAGSRGWHRLAVAIEDAGFVIHPSIFGWAYGSGFPKATRVKGDERFDGHRYGLQALKPALEPIIVFQKPYEGRPIDNIRQTGAGTLNIDAARIGIDEISIHGYKGDSYSQSYKSKGTTPELDEYRKSSGRWASNFVLLDEGAAAALDRQSGMSVSSDRIRHNNQSQFSGVKGIYGKFNDKDTFGFDDEGGASRFFFQVQEQIDSADPVFYEAKAGTEERNLGLREFEEKQAIGYQYSDEPNDPANGMFKDRDTKKKNTHPTVKALALTRYLASLLLPPAEYAPRRLFVPFAGVASEMIGAMQAGWDEITGVEMTEEYIPIAKARIEYWRNRGWQTPLFELPKE